MIIETLFGSRIRAKILGWLFSHPDEQYYVRKLTSILEEDSTNVSRELTRLEKAGILVSTYSGKQKFYRVDRNNPLFPELHGLMIKTSGAADVIRDSLQSVADKINVAFVFGSFAETRETSKSDIDLLVIGSVPFGDIVSVISEPEARLGRQVNPVVYDAVNFRKKVHEKQHFLTSVLGNKKIFLIGGEDELTRLAA